MSRILIPRSDSLGAKIIEPSDFEKYFSSDIVRDYRKSGFVITAGSGLAINIAVYDRNAEVEFLPLTCNWIASNVLPKYDEEKKSFVEPFLPHNKIGIMHLAAGIWDNNKDMRIDKNVTISIKTTKGKDLQKSLRYIQD